MIQQVLFYSIIIYLSLTAISSLFISIRTSSGLKKELDKDFLKNKKFAKYLIDHSVKARTLRFSARASGHIVCYLLIFIYSVFTGAAVRYEWWRY